MPLKVTVPLLWLKVPPEWVKLPAIVSWEGALKVPADKLKFLLISILFPFASKVPALLLKSLFTVRELFNWSVPLPE